MKAKRPTLTPFEVGLVLKAATDLLVVGRWFAHESQNGRTLPGEMATECNGLAGDLLWVIGQEDQRRVRSTITTMSDEENDR